MNRILSPNGHPMTAEKVIALPGQRQAHVQVYANPQGAGLMIYETGRDPHQIPLTSQALREIGVNCISAAAVFEAATRQQPETGGAPSGPDR